MEYVATKVTHRCILEQCMKQNEENVAYDKRLILEDKRQKIGKIILVLQSGTPEALLVSGITSDEPNPGGSSNIPNSASVSIGPASYTIIFWALIRAFIPAVRSVTKRIIFNRL